MNAPLEPAAALADVLVAEVEVLEKLHFWVVQSANLAAAGRQRFLAPAADGVLDTVEELGELELARALMVSDAAAAWALGDDQPTLAELAAAAPPPWPPVLAGLAARMRELVAAIDDAAGRGASFAADGRVRVRAALEALEGAAGYEADGASGGFSPVLGLIT